MTEATLNVPDISCGHCKESIEGAVSELQGVAKVDVSINDRTVFVSYGAPTEMNDVVNAIEGQGYEVGS